MVSSLHTPPPSLIDAWSCIWPTSLNQGNTLHSLFGAEIIFAIFFKVFTLLVNIYVPIRRQTMIIYETFGNSNSNS